MMINIIRHSVKAFFVILLIAVIASPGMANEHLDGEFQMAAGMGQMNKVRSLLKQGAGVNSRASSTDRVPAGLTALMLASANNHLEMCKFLVSHGAKVNQADEGGGTSLIYAVWKGNKDIVVFLIKNGANINARTIDGRTPISVAQQYGHYQIAKILKDNVKQ